MKALIFKENGHFPVLMDYALDKNQWDEEVVEVKLLASSMNRRDYYITQGLYPKIKTDTVLGSDGVGLYKGKRVLLNPNINWGDNPAHQSDEYEILGMPKHGTFAERLLIPEHRIHYCPDHLTDIEAASLPLGGMTAWRAIHGKGAAREGEKVLISGVGGGVAQLAMQFAVAMGAEVYVTSGSQEKIETAMELGARGGVSYKDENWSKKLKEMSGGFDVIIDSAGGDGFKNFIPISNPGARIVFYGGTLGKITEINPQIMFWRQISIHGTTMATDVEFEEMLTFVTTHKIRPVISQVFSLDEVDQAFKALGEGSGFGKIVFNHGA